MRKVIPILIAIPVLCGLVLLALYSVVLMLAVLTLILAGLLVLKHFKPEFFRIKVVEPEKHKDKIVVNEKRNRTYVILSAVGLRGTSRIVVDKTPFVIGRSDAADCTLQDDRVSRMHLRITYDPTDGSCSAEDMGSSNFTYKNDEKLVKGQKYKLFDGDILRIANKKYTVEYAKY